jgi:hypothetical protein
MKLAMGGAAREREAQLMISEKIAAASLAGLSLIGCASASSVIQGYRRKVRANRRQLCR